MKELRVWTDTYPFRHDGEYISLFFYDLHHAEFKRDLAYLLLQER